jgi:dihydrofolate reductase
MKISLLAAISRNGVIGRDGRLPWHLPADLRRFKQLTLGHPVIMGRKTYDSILAALGKPLPGRENIVVSRRTDATGAGGITVGSIEEALQRASTCPGGDAVYVIGGGEIYALALPHATHLDLTEIDADFAGDARFPAYDRAEWDEESREPAREGDLPYAFVTYRRRPPKRNPNEMPARGYQGP